MPTPGLDSARQIAAAIQDGNLTMEELDICVDSLLDAVLELKDKTGSKKEKFDEQRHHDLARQAAVESAVLLKNADNILPLKAECKVAVIGDFAVEPRYQGAGSSMVKPIFIETIEKSIVDYRLQVTGVSRGYKRTGETDEVLKNEALNLAAKADVVLYCFGLDEMSEVEGMDRSHMRIPQNQIELLQAMVQVNDKIIGILSAGASIEMPWHTCCKAILHGYLSGQAGASAMLDILSGKANPSGRLAESYPVRYEDTPAFRYFPSTERNAEYRESIYVGYRY